MTTSQSLRRTALITGASAGLGTEFARQLAARNLNLVLVARRQERLDELARELADEYGISVTTFAADLSERDAPERILGFVQGQGIEVDYLVNNAGSAGPNLLEERDWNKQATFFELMMISVAHMCHLFVPPMQERGFGRVLNVASVAGRMPRRRDCNYGPSKAYLIALSEALHQTVKDANVLVCALCPGFTHTDFHSTAGMLDMKNNMPKFLWYDAPVVVKEGLKALEAGKSVYVSGRLYRVADPLFQSVFTRNLLKRLSPTRP